MPKINRKKIVVIVGPTASGKSDLAIKLARKISAKGETSPQGGGQGAEIISADSRQVYRRMDIGTGKVSKKEQKIVPHHLIDVASPKKQFTADDFKKLSQKAINDILSRGKVPIIVGGTGFYVDVLLGRMSVAEVPPNQKLRKKLGNLEIEKLFEMLKKLDPQRAKTIEPKNKRRLIRALEIILIIGKPVPPQKSSKSTNYAIAEPVDTYKIIWIGMKLPRKVLEIRIKKRLDARLKQGMVKEVINLHKQGVGWKRLDELGLEYRWVSRWLIQNSKIKMQNDNAKFKIFKKSEYYEKLLREIIKYSKRQMTWFKRNPEINWVKNSREGENLAKSFL